LSCASIQIYIKSRRPPARAEQLFGDIENEKQQEIVADYVKEQRRGFKHQTAGEIAFSTGTGPEINSVPDDNNADNTQSAILIL